MASRRRAVLACVQLLQLTKPSPAIVVAPPIVSSSTAHAHYGRGRNWAPANERHSTAATSLAHYTIWKGARRMSCCAGLGSPPPREIVVEYSSSGQDADYTDEFIKLANAIEEAYPEFVVSGNPEDVNPRKGAFEIMVGDIVLFSKLQMNRLPDLREVLRSIDSLPSPKCTVP